MSKLTKSLSIYYSNYPYLYSGPVPVLFSEDVEAARAALDSDSARPGFDVNRINKNFIIPEFVTLPEAVELITNPREGTVATPFKRSSKGGKKIGNAPKKSKSSHTPTNTGSYKYLKSTYNFPL
jgi:hypothetical protein